MFTCAKRYQPGKHLPEPGSAGFIIWTWAIQIAVSSTQSPGPQTSLTWAKALGILPSIELVASTIWHGPGSQIYKHSLNSQDISRAQRFLQKQAMDCGSLTCAKFEQPIDVGLSLTYPFMAHSARWLILGDSSFIKLIRLILGWSGCY